MKKVTPERRVRRRRAGVAARVSDASPRSGRFAGVVRARAGRAAEPALPRPAPCLRLAAAGTGESPPVMIERVGHSQISLTVQPDQPHWEHLQPHPAGAAGTDHRADGGAAPGPVGAACCHQCCRKLKGETG